jgi:hypothetical protein
LGRLRAELSDVGQKIRRQLAHLEAEEPESEGARLLRGLLEALQLEAIHDPRAHELKVSVVLSLRVFEGGCNLEGNLETAGRDRTKPV